MRVLGFGSYDSSRHPRVGILLDGLRAHGDDVVERNEPIGFTTAERVAMLERPWLAYRLPLRMLMSWARLVRRRRGVGSVDAVIVGYLGHFDVLLARLLFPRSRIVLDLLVLAADTARDRGVPSGARLRLLDLLDRAAVRCADLVMLDTEENIALLPPAARRKTVIVPVGAPAAWFAAGDTGRPAGRPLRVAFFGLYTPLQGAPVIGAALALLAGRDDIAVTMIGSGQDYAETRRAARGSTNATWLDWTEPDELPALVGGHDICLGIFATTPKALRVVPNKVFQGAAAGCAIVTSDTPPQRRLLAEAAVYVAPGDPVALAAALGELAGDPARVDTLRAASRAVAADRFTPSTVVIALRRALLRAERPI